MKLVRIEDDSNGGLEKFRGFKGKSRDCLVFDNGLILWAGHPQDCGELVFAHFGGMQAMGVQNGNSVDSEDLDFFDDILNSIVPIAGLGFYIVTKQGICLLVPCYNYQNGYYSSNIVLYYDDKMRDLGACTKFFNDVYVEIDEMRSILDKKISSSHDIPIAQGRDYLELVQSGRDLGSESDSVPCATCVHGAVSRKQVEHVLSFWNPPCKNQYFDDFDCSCDIGYDCKVASDLMMSGNLCKGFERSSEKQEEKEE